MGGGSGRGGKNPHFLFLFFLRLPLFHEMLLHLKWILEIDILTFPFIWIFHINIFLLHWFSYQFIITIKMNQVPWIRHDKIWNKHGFGLLQRMQCVYISYWCRNKNKYTCSMKSTIVQFTLQILDILFIKFQINCCHLNARETCKYLVIKLAEISEIQLSSIGQNSINWE